MPKAPTSFENTSTASRTTAAAPVKVVVVEDSTTDFELVRRHLARSRSDCTLHRVETEAELIKALHDIRPDLILSDFSMPRFDGLRALEIATVYAPEVPFIFVSGTIGEE